MKNIECLVAQFRHAIDKALTMGEFNDDPSLYDFPQGCCGDASDLLAQYLQDNGIETYYVCGSFYYDDTTRMPQSHAWLCTEDGIIIDITGDQFKDRPIFLNYDVPVYVGTMDKFHRLFEVEDRTVHIAVGIKEKDCISMLRLCDMYQKIVKYL